MSATHASEVFSGPGCRVVSIVDGRPEHELGVRMLRLTLATVHAAAPNRAVFTLLCPSDVGASTIRQMSSRIGCAVLGLPRPEPPEPKDPYYTKLLLRSFLNSHASDSERILYLDYDHIIRRSIRLPPVSKGQIYVSSEVHRLGDLAPMSVNSTDRERLADKHHNTSLIFGLRSTLRTVASRWPAAYAQLQGIPTRYREEIAFALSASLADIKIVPSPPTLQGNWHVPDPSCALFHYGGEGQTAYTVKRELRDPQSARSVGDRFAREICQIACRVRTEDPDVQS